LLVFYIIVERIIAKDKHEPITFTSNLPSIEIVCEFVKTLKANIEAMTLENISN